MNEKTETVTFSDESLELIQKIIKRYPEGRQKSAVLPVLHIAQAESGGWLSPEVMEYVASLLDILPIEVFEVASFYSMFNLKPIGQCVFEVCQTGPCALNGSEEILAFLENKLGIKTGETTADGKFSIKAVECLAACGNGPVVQVGQTYFENMDVEKTGRLLERFIEENHYSHQNPYQKK